MADVYDLFLQNWINAVGMDTSWLNALNVSAENLVHEGRGLASKPRRALTVRWDAIDQDEGHRLFFLLARIGHQRLRVPLYQDVVRTTATSSLVTINAVPTSRRFHAGQRLVIHERTSGRPTNVQYRVVAATGPGTITLTVALTGSYPAGSMVYPVMDAEIALSANATPYTDHKATLQHTFLEVATTALPATGDYAGAGAQTFQAANGANYYLFEPGPNWTKDVGYSMGRSGNERDLGRDHVVVVRGPRPQFSFRFSFDAVTKAEFFNVLRFFDGHRGRLVPFFVANPMSIWTVENIGLAFVDVTRSGDIDDPLLFASYVFLEMLNGDVYVRPVTGVTDVGGLNRLAVSPVLPVLLANNVKRATTAHLCRFANDSLREEWYNDSVATVQIEVQEVLNEEITVTL